MSPDILVLSVPLRAGMVYPSANHQGADAVRWGTKSDAYRALAFDVEEAARAAVADGWETVEYPCRAWITRYKPDARVMDAGNLGSCEMNAMTRAGVWTDDELARPITFDVQPRRSAGPDRIVIVVQRLTPALGAVARKARPTKSTVAKTASHNEGEPYVAGTAIPDGFVLLNGRVVRMSVQEVLQRANLVKP